MAHTQGAMDWGWGGDELPMDGGNEENEERAVRAGGGGGGGVTTTPAATAPPAAVPAAAAGGPGPAAPQMWFKVDGGPPLVRNVLIHKGWLELETPEGATSPPRHGSMSASGATSPGSGPSSGPSSLPPQPPPPQHPPTGSPAVCAAIAALNLTVDTPPGQPFSPRKAPAEKHAEVYKVSGSGVHAYYIRVLCYTRTIRVLNAYYTATTSYYSTSYDPVRVSWSCIDAPNTPGDANSRRLLLNPAFYHPSV